MNRIKSDIPNEKIASTLIEAIEQEENQGSRFKSTWPNI